ncbi:hypothetical protein Tco_0333576 [Tanacetum coccineum]
MYNEWGQKLKGPTVEDSPIQSLLDLQKGSKASRLKSLRQKKQLVKREESSASQNKYYSSLDTDSDATLYSSSSDKPKGSTNETDDPDESDMDLLDDNLYEDDDDARYGVFMYNKSTATPNSTYLSLTVTSSTLDFIQTLLDETPINELTDFMSYLVYTDAQTTSVVHNPEGNPKLTSYISDASEVPLAKKIPYPTIYPQLSSLQAKAKKVMQKAKLNMRKLNFKKAVAHEFKEYDQNLEALINFNILKHLKKPTEETYTTSITKYYAARYYKEGIEDMIPKRWSKEVQHYHFEALNRINFFKAGTSAVTEGNVFSDLRINQLRFNDKEYEFSYADLPRLSMNDVEDMYLLQVQDKLHHLPLEFVKDFNNALLMFIRRTMIKNRLSEVEKFSDGTLVKIQENLIDMLSKNKLGRGNKRLKGRD